MTDTSREALIKMLIECLAGPAALTTREATAIKDAADMLEADARDTAWQRGFQSGVSSNEKTAKDAIAALAAEQAAHRETNRLMTEALTQAEALTPMLTPILCDKCGIETPDPWHSSEGANKHIHTCDACHAHQAATGERAELIAGLREHATFMCIEGGEKQRTLKAADMLEADGKPKNFLRLRGQLEQEWAEVRALKEASKAQQVAVPAWTIAEERMGQGLLERRRKQRDCF